MNKKVIASSDEFVTISLRSIEESDQENLRRWKNANAQYFFYQKTITPKQQEEWFRGYLGRQEDALFIVHAAGEDIGCMGIRLLDDTWDIYNVILGETQFGGKGYMGQAMSVLCSYALSMNPKRITAKVLAKNPAIEWYCKHHFIIKERHDDHVEIELDKSQFRQVPISLDASQGKE
jgi:RimJ/RimL family protein N-acetyltransferase